MVCCTIQAPGRGLTVRQSQFNYQLSRIRIQCEHAIGLLKIRFQSLKELRIQIDSVNKIDSVIIWIRCCIILHNLIIEHEGKESGVIIPREWQQAIEGEVDDNGEEIDADVDDSNQQGPLPQNPTQTLRERLFDSLFSSDLY
ncbi:hypothetical protein SERLA73DRAFT_69472 [Serpula lacrymans var. lacrymans S7.3]|uniref:DDE Tnp4 domain-containing protein n=1 Tax=Serpula lacrymans var. lacrymans (strain S7.3) TaxID=936435 RepID=F8PKY0_SERL3|nr:hypothetical protein SERLA73DRAFT_69472 [Serpula lacrymans var. lacrymans S7.3]